jgi:hypothetical protein
MAKQWYKSKGGWIGAGIGLILIFTPLNPFISSDGYKLPNGLSWIFPIVGFIIGKWISKNK